MSYQFNVKNVAIAAALPSIISTYVRCSIYSKLCHNSKLSTNQQQIISNIFAFASHWSLAAVIYNYLESDSEQDSVVDAGVLDSNEVVSEDEFVQDLAGIYAEQTSEEI